MIDHSKFEENVRVVQDDSSGWWQILGQEIVKATLHEYDLVEWTVRLGDKESSLDLMVRGTDTSPSTFTLRFKGVTDLHVEGSGVRHANPGQITGTDGFEGWYQLQLLAMTLSFRSTCQLLFSVVE